MASVGLTRGHGHRSRSTSQDHAGDILRSGDPAPHAAQPDAPRPDPDARIPAPAPTVGAIPPAGPQPIVFKTFTPRTLLKNNGTDNSPVYLAVRGKVYDVSSGRNFYGPGGPYENFAGRDATRGLACQSFDEEMLTKDLDGPLDPCDDLTPEQVDNLNGWIERFDEKYLVVGKLLPFRKTDFH
ncbi:Cytochrome b5-like Heme/Steroid binding domain-containing protein [Cladophialophora immunda]|nr:Cytochrome b5-like Heme/Steroid binding domain-containing protein [Cladophialophora immunda]